MIRTSKLAVSRPHYAFNPASWRPAPGAGYEVDAIWFKKTQGTLDVTFGVYQPMVTPRADAPDDGSYSSWVEAANDNRYGGKWLAKWDGTGLKVYTNPITPSVMEHYINLLDPILKNYPDVPPGYDGWWTLPRPTDSWGRRV